MFDYKYNKEIPSEIRHIIEALEKLDGIKTEEMWRYDRYIDYEYRDELPKHFSGKDLIDNAIKNEILSPVEKGQYIMKSPYNGVINVIPSRGKGVCCEMLLVFIGDKDNFEKRIFQALEHTGIICRNITKYVIFYAFKWETIIWEKHYNSFVELVDKDRLRCVVKKMFRESPIRLI
ncbi:MAG: hypothetical protein RMJ67_08025 [Elusimicrobiota bacterium]|nr:hypothetical protein [Endomicrobiia bacterium]MDW8166441.1 hypothetical protein [Elusimicrobiota bacterium]